MDQTVPVKNGAEAFLELLSSNGVQYIFLNPGTDTFPITEAISRYKTLGKPCPEVVLCLDESVAMAAAHGHFMLSNKPQVVIVHADLGPQQVGGALHNAQRGRIGVLLCSGRVPASLEQGRKNQVHWLQEQFDQSGVVRDYVKWDYELRSTDNIQHVVQRAFQVASSEPCGPVYLSLPQDTLTQKMTGVTLPSIARHSPAVSPQANLAVLEEVASILLKARHPLIITGYSGRHPDSVRSLVSLADTLGARVVDSPNRLNFPTEHPLYAGFEANPYLAEADVILSIDTDVPYVPSQATPRPEAKIIHLDIDPLKTDMPLWGFPVDYLIHADSEIAIPQLCRIVSAKITIRQAGLIQSRRRRLAKEHEQMKNNWSSLALAGAAKKPISPEWLCHCVDQALDQDAVVLAEVVTNRQALLRQLRRTRPGTYFQSGGSSLGWGLGAALGAKLASPGKTVVTLVGDGSFVFGCPTAALWGASVNHAPFLCVIFNNLRYNAPSLALRQALGKDSPPVPLVQVGIDIKPSPDYASIAVASFAHGKRVDDADDLPSALKLALDQVRSGKAAVLDVRISPGP
jgi:acetolactate synthase-1/2/3 large subunit